VTVVDEAVWLPEDGVVLTAAVKVEVEVVLDDGTVGFP